MQNLYREKGRQSGTFISIAARFECATSRTARCALGTFPLFLSAGERKTGACSRDKGARVHAIETKRQREKRRGEGGVVSEDREAEVEEDGSKPDTRFVRRVYPVSRK